MCQWNTYQCFVIIFRFEGSSTEVPLRPDHRDPSTFMQTTTPTPNIQVFKEGYESKDPAPDTSWQNHLHGRWYPLHHRNNWSMTRRIVMFFLIKFIEESKILDDTKSASFPPCVSPCLSLIICFVVSLFHQFLIHFSVVYRYISPPPPPP